MTSESLSSMTKPLSRRAIMREITMRRLYVIVFTMVPLLLYYPFGAMMTIAGLRGQSAYYSSYGLDSASSFLSYRLAGYIGGGSLTIPLAVLLGLFVSLQGFSYLFSVQQVDFFESQPMSRRQRFLRLYVHGLVMYMAASASCLLLTALISLATGTLNGAVFGEIVLAFVRDFCAFFASYGIGCLSAMLCGNLIYAIALSAFLLGFQYIVKLVVTDYMTQFFRTFADGYTDIAAPFSVPYHLEQLLKNTGGVMTRYQNGVSAYFRRILGLGAPHFLALLAVGAAAALLALYAYKKRRAESAGMTLCHDRLHVIIKFLTAVTGGLVSGSLLRVFYYDDMGSPTSFFRLSVVVLVFTALCAIAIEAMYKGSVRGGIKRFYHVPVAMSLAYLILLIFRLDVIGYDRFTPTEGKVESVALIHESYNYYFDYPTNYMDESGEGYLSEKEFVEKYMYLTDIDAIGELVMLDRATYDNVDPYDAPAGYDCVLAYRMHGGAKKYRRIRIPYTVDEALMERVVGSEAYKMGVYQINHDQGITDDLLTRSALIFDTGFKMLRGEGTLYRAFSDAYRADLATLTFAELKSTEALGYVTLEYTRTSPANGTNYINFAVYPSFTETVAFLKEHDLYAETDPDPSLIDTVEIEFYYPTSPEEEAQGLYGTWDTVVFDDPETVRGILDASLHDRLLSRWFDLSSVAEGLYFRRVHFQTRPTDPAAWYDKDRSEDYAVSMRYLIKELLPEEVLEQGAQ